MADPIEQAIRALQEITTAQTIVLAVLLQDASKATREHVALRSEQFAAQALGSTLSDESIHSIQSAIQRMLSLTG